ncbi:RICIN domain-containing protein [Embleya sp. NPDC020886]|uniref:RICIN domain-containing protein n=1 Tax=Embleya sp. NPDC020886 TaxID=3363980 RepID=UPI0037BB7BDA
MLLLLSLVAAFLVGTAGTATAESAPPVPVAGAPEDQPRLLQEYLAKHKPPGLTRGSDDEWPWNNENNQLINFFSQKCMVALPAADLFGVMQYQCREAYADQRWTIWRPVDFLNSRRIGADFTGKCLQVDGATVTTQSCNDYTLGQEVILIIDTTASWFQLKTAYACVYANGAGNGAPISAYTCGNYADQWWTWYLGDAN